MRRILAIAIAILSSDLCRFSVDALTSATDAPHMTNENPIVNKDLAQIKEAKAKEKSNLAQEMTTSADSAKKDEKSNVNKDGTKVKDPKADKKSNLAKDIKNTVQDTTWTQSLSNLSYDALTKKERKALIQALRNASKSRPDAFSESEQNIQKRSEENPDQSSSSETLPEMESDLHGDIEHDHIFGSSTDMLTTTEDVAENVVDAAIMDDERGSATGGSTRYSFDLYAYLCCPVINNLCFP
jgi:hypothetical protein